MVTISVSPHRISDRLLNPVDGVTSVKKKEHKHSALICIGMWLIDVSVFSRIPKRDQTETRLCVLANVFQYHGNSIIALSTDNWDLLDDS